MKHNHETRHFLFKWSGTWMYHHKTPGEESLKQTADNMWFAITARRNSGFLFLKTLFLLLDNLLPQPSTLNPPGYNFNIDIKIDIDTITINTLLNKYSHMRSRGENDFNMPWTPWCYLRIATVLAPSGPRSTRGLWGSSWRTACAQPARARHCAWRCLTQCESPNKPSRVRGYAGSWLACRLAVWINSKSRLKEGFRVAFTRQFRQDAQCFRTDDEHSTRSGKSSPLYSDSRENSLLACDAGLHTLHQAILRWNISGRMDVMADALSRWPSEKPISQRLSQLLCGTQLVHTEWVENVVVQNVFH